MDSTGSGPLASDIAAALERAREALSATPAGLFTDVDGTISEIVDTPEQARVQPAARRALRRLASELAVVAAVSGRAAADARRMVRVAGITYVGNHGLELLRGKSRLVHPDAVPYLQPLHECLSELRERFEGTGIRVEDKSVSGAVHYRLASDPELARERIGGALKSSASCRPLRRTEGRMVVNILPPVEVTKGTAVRSIIKERGLHGVVYLGDDVTDLDAFEMLRQLRAEGLSTVAIAVSSPEAPSALADLADVTVPGVEAVVALLDSLGAEEIGHGKARNQRRQVSQLAEHPHRDIVRLHLGA